MLNYGMCGHMNTSCDMETQGPGVHFGFLQPWSQHNNWAYATQPWFLGKQAEAIYRDYARLRYRLMPYIYSAAHVGSLTALPILRPMPLVFPGDPKLADCTTEYMLGDSLLVTAFSDKVYLPGGHWIDYWSGAEYEGPREMACTYPKNRAGGLFLRAGAIIPYWPEMDYVGEQPVQTLQLHVYPEGKSDYTLYEDDGDSLEYLKGAVAQTSIRCEANQSRVMLTIGLRQGSYRGMPSVRGYEVSLHMARPKTVTVTGATDAPKVNWSYNAEAKTVCLAVTEDLQRKTPMVIQCDL
jgi:alpha-glucosidase (family GH31 glycosyl hydrolase)